MFEKIQYEILDEFGGVPNCHKYEISDTAKSEQEWRAILSAFATEFSEFKSTDKKDYEFGDWHHGMRSAFVYLYNGKFYDYNFLTRVQKVLIQRPFECYAHFECYSDRSLAGYVMVFTRKVLFDRLSEETGLLSKLIPSAK